MRNPSLWVLAITFSSLAFGQLESNSITVTASRSIVLQPDEAVFGIAVIALPDVSFDEILAAVRAAGVTAENFTGIGGFFPVARPVTAPAILRWGWQFTLAVPVSKLKDTQLALASVQGMMDGARLQMSFSVSGMRTSPQLLAAQQCPVMDVIGEARVQAQKMAAAAGLALGPILAVADGSTIPNAAAVSAPLAVVRSGDFSGVGGVITGSFLFATPLLLTRPVAVCSVAVKFKLGG